ncbi:MAG: metallophosphoesterase [Candidatus Altiarchaeota archaeon]|nr:metallophosphoesterase [Candidatus Altiarchaeota archaeon]
MDILSGVEIHGLGLYLRGQRTLVIADLHLGYEEELMRFGYLVPRFQYNEIIEHMEKILSEVDAEKVVINGDLKHEFGRISEQEWTEVLNFLDFLSERVEEIILVRGNHDTIIGPIASKRKVKIQEKYFIGEDGVYITHGHEIPSDNDFKKSRVVVIAHDHPAISLREEIRVEKVKCFLKGNWGDKILIQMPSLNFVTEGTDLTKEKPLSPFMDQDLDEFEAYGVEGFKVFYFGRITGLL